jgi:hypothetical protein
MTISQFLNFASIQKEISQKENNEFEKIIFNEE